MRLPDLRECPAEFPPCKRGDTTMAYCCTRRRFHWGDHKATGTDHQVLRSWWRMWKPRPEDGGPPLARIRHILAVTLTAIACSTTFSNAGNWASTAISHGRWLAAAGWTVVMLACAWFYGLCFLWLRAARKRLRARPEPLITAPRVWEFRLGGMTYTIPGGRTVFTVPAGHLSFTQYAEHVAQIEARNMRTFDLTEYQPGILIDQVLGG